MKRCVLAVSRIQSWCDFSLFFTAFSSFFTVFHSVLLYVSLICTVFHWHRVKRSGKQLLDLFAKIDVDGSGDYDIGDRFVLQLMNSVLNIMDLVVNNDELNTKKKCTGEFRAGMLSIGLTFNDATISALMSYMDGDGGVSKDYGFLHEERGILY